MRRRRVALALSPHLDDAAFSAGATLARLARSGWEVWVATLFTASVPHPAGFALACQLDKGLSADADYMAIRRAEERAACAALRARPPVLLGLEEAPHRGYASARVLFGKPRAGDDAARQARPLLARLVRRVRPRLILAPQAIGGHVDHVALLRALWSLRPRAEIWHWEDFPYTLRRRSHPARPFAARMRALPPLAVRGDLRAKNATCAAYATQLGFQFGGAAAKTRATRATRVERFRRQRIGRA